MLLPALHSAGIICRHHLLGRSGQRSGPGLASSARGLLIAAADDEPLGVASLLDLFEPVRAVVRAARGAARHIDDGYEAVSIFFGASEARVLEIPCGIVRFERFAGFQLAKWGRHAARLLCSSALVGAFSIMSRRFSSGRRGSGWRRLAEHGLPVEPFALGEVLAPDPG